MNCISVDSIVTLESISLSFLIQTAISRPNTMKNRMISLWLELGQTLFNHEGKRHRRLRSNCVENRTKASWKGDLVPKSCSISWINLKVQHHSYIYYIGKENKSGPLRFQEYKILENLTRNERNFRANSWKGDLGLKSYSVFWITVRGRAKQKNKRTPHFFACKQECTVNKYNSSSC